MSHSSDPFTPSRQSWPRARTFSQDGRVASSGSVSRLSGTSPSLIGSANASFPRDAGRSSAKYDDLRLDDNDLEALFESESPPASPSKLKTDHSLITKTSGAPEVPTSSSPSNNSATTRAMPQHLKMVLFLAAAGIIAALTWNFRKSLAVYFDKDEMQERAVKILTRLDKLPKVRSHLAYALGFTLWETVGLSTIPVETAAGMIFGWDAFYLSSIGKTLGAVLAFCIGRYGCLANWVQRQLSANAFLNLVKESTKTSPLMVSFILKCTCFPENVKNYGAAVLSPIQLWMFTLSSFIHGTVFALLFTYIGVDASHRIRDTNYPPDKLLQVLLGLAGANAFVISPLAMAAWLRKLRKDSLSKGPTSDSDTVATESSNEEDEDQERVELIAKQSV